MTARATGTAAGLALTAATFGQFSGSYAPGNWTFDANGGDGSVNTASAPAFIVLTGNDNGFGPIETDYTIAAAATGTLSFSWLYTTIDTDTSDAAYYLVNGVATFLANSVTVPVGTVGPIPVTAGQVIGFRVTSTDGVFGPGVLTITNFSGPVPAPGGFALAGAVALMTARRRRR